MKIALKHTLLGAALILATGGAQAQATTYTATKTGNYTSKTDFTAPCAAGPCQNFTTAMGHSGSFTTASPLAPNLSLANIAASVTAFSFSDGITTYASADPQVRKYRFEVTTNATEAITATSIWIERWETGASPHVAGGRFSYIGLSGFAFHNLACANVGVSPASDADSCTSFSPGTNESDASGSTVSWSSAVAPVPAVTASIPTLSEWGLIAMAGLMGIAGLAALRRRQG